GGKGSKAREARGKARTEWSCPACLDTPRKTRHHVGNTSYRRGCMYEKPPEGFPGHAGDWLGHSLPPVLQMMTPVRLARGDGSQRGRHTTRGEHAMQIVDAQIHLWGSGLPSNQAHRQVTAFTTEEAVGLMDEGGVDAAVI